MLRLRIEHGNIIFKGKAPISVMVNGVKKRLMPGVVYECSLYRQFFTKKRYSLTVRFAGVPGAAVLYDGPQVNWWFKRMFLKTKRRILWW